ncbi:hypothetical protein CR513_21017, partial [Mucuna pruriens]
MLRDIQFVLSSKALIKKKALIIMTQLANSDLELHKMEVKNVFINSIIDETIYMSMVCKLKNFIYALEQVFCQWYYKFHQVITFYGFEANWIDDCIYQKFCDGFEANWIDDCIYQKFCGS